MYQYDYLMRQIEVGLKTLVVLIMGESGAKNIEEILEPLNNDEKFNKLKKLLEENKFNEGEDYLYILLEDDSIDYRQKMVYGYYLYRYMSKIPEETLKENDFSRSEVEEGLDDFLSYFMK